MSVGLPTQAQQDRITVDANRLGFGKTISNGVAEGTGAASQIQDPQGPVPGADCGQHLQHCPDALVTELGCAVVMVLHDLNLAARFCTRLLVINDGEVVASGTPDEVLTPEILEPIYHLKVHRLVHENLPHLIFSPETESRENE